MNPKHIYETAEKIADLIAGGRAEEAQKALEALKAEAVKEAAKT